MSILEAAVENPTADPIFPAVVAEETRSKVKKELATRIAKGDEPLVRPSRIRQIGTQTAENGNHVLLPIFAVRLWRKKKQSRRAKEENRNCCKVLPFPVASHEEKGSNYKRFKKISL